MSSTSKVDWQYAYLEKLKAPKVRLLFGERGVVIDGQIAPQIEQITSAGFPSWTLFNHTRRHLLGAVSTSITFGFLQYNGEYRQLLADIHTLREELSNDEQSGPTISRAVIDGAGPSTHILVDFSFRVDKLGSDLSLTRNQKISSSFRLKKIGDNSYVMWCHPNTRYDYQQMMRLVNDAAKYSDHQSNPYPYAPCPTVKNESKHFSTGDDINNYFINLFTNGFLNFNCHDVFKADTFEWNSGFEFNPRTGDEVVRDRAEIIKRIRMEGAQLNPGSGRVNELIGQGYAIHHFGATFSATVGNKTYQLPLEFRFTSKPLSASITGGPLSIKINDHDWTDYPGKEAVEKLLLGSLEHLLQAIHNNADIRLPGAYRSINEVP
ncbi:hypothetical protein GCM10025857_07700 [Alicyclobacillus contaminans]|uniref:hypothetical protein n=1 Tax=Alicyclobacillus contaminans TaxID=392016 RepID=UPI000428EB82|nr:hypothetical protein [Alicyclobacillus contaminans]GMA49413.1 hypothetical protein GCM10025857_07700 [Alicyclobacillus contaminans]